MKYCKYSLPSCWFVYWNVSILFLRAPRQRYEVSGGAREIQQKYEWKKRVNTVLKEQQENMVAALRTSISQLRQLIDRCVKLEVWREEFCGTWVDETVRLSDRDVSDTGDVPDFCGSGQRSGSTFTI